MHGLIFICVGLIVKYNGPHPLLQSTLVFLCVLGFENSSWMWLKHDHPDECGPEEHFR